MHRIIILKLVRHSRSFRGSMADLLQRIPPILTQLDHRDHVTFEMLVHATFTSEHSKHSASLRLQQTVLPHSFTHGKISRNVLVFKVNASYSSTEYQSSIVVRVVKFARCGDIRNIPGRKHFNHGPLESLIDSCLNQAMKHLYFSNL